MRKEKVATLILGAIVEMSDHAEKMGGATSISGVAALHKLQATIQNNRSLIIALLQEEANAEKADAA